MPNPCNGITEYIVRYKPGESRRQRGREREKREREREREKEKWREGEIKRMAFMDTGRDKICCRVTRRFRIVF